MLPFSFVQAIALKPFGGVHIMLKDRFIVFKISFPWEIGTFCNRMIRTQKDTLNLSVIHMIVLQFLAEATSLFCPLSICPGIFCSRPPF